MSCRQVGVVLAGLSFLVPFFAPNPAASAPVQVPRFGWPLEGAPPDVVRAFVPPPSPYGPGHRGVDLGGRPGAPVRSAGAGVVTFAGSVAGRPVVSVSHSGGLRTTYEPVASGLRAGARVGRGAALGVLEAGHAGCPVAACLHWGLRSGDVYLDPLALLRRARVRLLPVDGAPVASVFGVVGPGRPIPVASASVFGVVGPG